MSNDEPRKDVDVYWSIYANVGHALSNLMMMMVMISMDADWDGHTSVRQVSVYQ